MISAATGLGSDQTVRPVTERMPQVAGTALYLPFIRIDSTGASLSYNPSVEVCIGDVGCRATASLQLALDAAMDQPDQPVTIRLGPGIYTNWGSTLSVRQKQWTSGCADATYGTSFLLKERKAPTIISGQTGNPEDVIIWGGREHPSSTVAHTLTLDNNPVTVTLSSLSLISNGSQEENGAAPASLNIVNTKSELIRSIVSANKTWENPTREAILLEGSDQEGVAVYGETAHVRIFQSLLAGNFHTGLTAYENGSAEIIASYVRENGWSPWTSRFDGIGHGISALGTDFCYGGNNQLRVWNTIVAGNSGAGILIRGKLEEKHPTIIHNTLVGNQRGGIRIQSLTASASTLLLANNLIDANGNPGGLFISPGVQLDEASSISLFHNNSTRNQGNDYTTEGISLEWANNLPTVTISFTNPLFDPVDYTLLTTSPLRGQAWAGNTDIETPAPDISSYANAAHPDFLFDRETLHLWCQLYRVLELLGTPTYENPCSSRNYFWNMSRDSNHPVNANDSADQMEARDSDEDE